MTLDPRTPDLEAPSQLTVSQAVLHAEEDPDVLRPLEALERAGPTGQRGAQTLRSVVAVGGLMVFATALVIAAASPSRVPRWRDTARLRTQFARLFS